MSKESAERRLRLATVWLDGCSGCHMSFLDLDERLIELADPADGGEFTEDDRNAVMYAASAFGQFLRRRGLVLSTEPERSSPGNLPAI